jgi:hypothetical protein
MKLVRLIKMCLNKNYRSVWVGKHLDIKNGLKQENALSPRLFNFALDCVIRWVQVKEDGFKFNDTHQLLLYADDVNLGEEAYIL